MLNLLTIDEKQAKKVKKKMDLTAKGLLDALYRVSDLELTAKLEKEITRIAKEAYYHGYVAGMRA